MRHAAGWSQEELAERAELTPAAIGALERGERRHPYPRTLQALAAAFGLADAERTAFFDSVPRRRTGRDSAEAGGDGATAGRWRLPVPATRLVGRDRELAELESLLAREDVGLLTLVGAGGCGKTHLAIEVARRMEEAIPSGVHFVDLAPLTSPGQVLPALAQVLGVADEGERDDLRAAVARRLEDAAPWILFDNFEHLLDAAVDLAVLLDSGTRAKFLVTSRAPLRIRREHEYAVPPLGLPEAGEAATLEQISAAPAVALFLERARAVSPFQLGSDNAAAVVALCRRLDGLPLALELAAAATKLLLPQELLARFGQRFELPGGLERRDVPERHRTLRAAIGWSLGLLDAGERRLFRRLGVFAGAWTLAAAEAVAGADDGSPATAAQLLALVDQGLVQRTAEGTGAETRYRLLETVRAHALEELSASGEEEGVRGCLAGWMVERMEAVGEELDRTRPAALRQVAVEEPEVRAALAWLLRGRRAEEALRLAAATAPWWLVSGQIAEGLSWLDPVLSLVGADSAPSRHRARAEVGRASLLARTRDVAGARRRAGEALATAEAAGNPRAAAHAQFLLALAALDDGDPRDAVARLETCREIGHRSGEKSWEGMALLVLARVDEERGELEAAQASFAGAIELLRASGEIWGLARALGAASGFELRRGETARCAGLAREALELYRELGSVWIEPECFQNLAGVLTRVGNEEGAARLAGVASALAEAQATQAARPSGIFLGLLDPRSGQLGGAHTAWRSARGLPLPEAIELALEATERLRFAESP